MTVFAVVGISNAAAIGAAVVKVYGENHYKVADNVWLVPDSGTTKDISDRLGIANNRLNATAAVFRFDGYSGYAPRAAWEWLARQPGTIANG
jgi:hypothetical protein